MLSSRQSPGLVRCNRCQGYFSAEHLRSGRHFCLPPSAGHSSVSDEELEDARRLRSALGVAYGDTWPSGHLRPEESWFYPAQNVARATQRRLDAYDSGEVRRHYAGAAGAVVSGQWTEYRTPARAATVSSDVFVPFLQASASAFVVGAAAATTYGAVWRFLLAGAWPALGDMLAAAAVLGVIAFAVIWLQLLGEHRRHLWNVETVETPAPEQPPAPSVEPEPEQRPIVGVRLEVDEEHPESGGLYRTVLQNLDIPEDALRQTARMVNGGRSFSVRSLCGSGPLTSTQLEELRAFLIARGFMAWKDENERRSGVILTLSGKRLFARLADS